MRVIDLSVPITPGHIRWPAERTVKGNLAAGDLFQVSTIKVTCHGFTHVDARSHFFADGAGIEATPLDALVGSAAVVDLMDAEPDQPITAELLARRCGHVAADDRVILKSGWHRHRSILEPAYWLDSPYLTRDAALYLKDRRVRTIAYDFPQDYVIRLLLSGEVRPIEEHVTHDILLRAGVHMIEYLTNTAEIRASRLHLSAAPIKIPGADGAPARVYVIEDLV